VNSKIQIFVGGSGRSGTSFVARRIGQSEEIARVPYETRFLTDNRGMIDLYNSLTGSFSIDMARSSIREFKELMMELDSPFFSPYVGYRLSRLIENRNKYIELLENFLGEVSHGQFYAWDKQNVDRYSHLMLLYRLFFRSIAFISSSQKVRFNYKRIRTKSHLYLPKYYSDKSELAKIISRYVDSLFYSYALQEGKVGWCENTPSSILHYEDLQAFFPRAYFINVVRNPVAVACSLLDREWAPKDEHSVVNYLLPLYQRLIDVDSVANKKSNKYKLIKFESLESAEGMDTLFDFIGLKSIDGKIEKFKPIGASAWKNRYNSSTIEYLEKRLEEPLKYFGYL
jgi:omega-hydroxy-beta-dihydromenaquinone-9 sulfotransferase